MRSDAVDGVQQLPHRRHEGDLGERAPARKALRSACGARGSCGRPCRRASKSVVRSCASPIGVRELGPGRVYRTAEGRGRRPGPKRLRRRHGRLRSRRRLRRSAQPSAMRPMRSTGAALSAPTPAVRGMVILKGLPRVGGRACPGSWRVAGDAEKPSIDRCRGALPVRPERHAPDSIATMYRSWPGPWRATALLACRPWRRR
jgi:hypothetical protein